MSAKISESTVLSKLQTFSKTKSSDSQSFDVHNFQIVIENVEVRGKIRIAKKVKCVGGSNSTYTVPWVLNDQSDCCMRCDQKFGTFIWRHHCRRCGFLVCSNCSPNTIAYQYLSVANPVRACNDCWRAHHSRNNRGNKNGRNEEDTPEEEPEPLLTRVPSWVQGGAERNSDVSPPKRISESIRRVSETPLDSGTPGNSNRTSRISITSEVSPRPSTSGPVTTPSIPEEEVPVVVGSVQDAEKILVTSQHTTPLSPQSVENCDTQVNDTNSKACGETGTSTKDLKQESGEAITAKVGGNKKNRKRGKKNSN